MLARRLNSLELLDLRVRYIPDVVVGAMRPNLWLALAEEEGLEWVVPVEFSVGAGVK